MNNGFLCGGMKMKVITTISDEAFHIAMVVGSHLSVRVSYTDKLWQLSVGLVDLKGMISQYCWWKPLSI